MAFIGCPSVEVRKEAWFLNPFVYFKVDNNIVLKFLSTKLLQDITFTHLAGSIDKKRQSGQHQLLPPLTTLVCSERKTSRYLLFDSNNRLKGWINEKTGEVKSPFSNFDPRHYRKLAFAGIQILQPSIFQYMAGFPERFSIIDFYLSICDKTNVVCHVPENLKLMDMGKMDSLQEAVQFLPFLTS